MLLTFNGFYLLSLSHPGLMSKLLHCPGFLEQWNDTLGHTIMSFHNPPAEHDTSFVAGVGRLLTSKTHALAQMCVPPEAVVSDEQHHQLIQGDPPFHVFGSPPMRRTRDGDWKCFRPNSHVTFQPSGPAIFEHWVEQHFFRLFRDARNALRAHCPGPPLVNLMPIGLSAPKKPPAHRRPILGQILGDALVFGRNEMEGICRFRPGTVPTDSPSMWFERLGDRS